MNLQSPQQINQIVTTSTADTNKRTDLEKLRAILATDYKTMSTIDMSNVAQQQRELESLAIIQAMQKTINDNSEQKRVQAEKQRALEKAELQQRMEEGEKRQQEIIEQIQNNSNKITLLIEANKTSEDVMHSLKINISSLQTITLLLSTHIEDSETKNEKLTAAIGLLQNQCSILNTKVEQQQQNHDKLLLESIEATTSLLNATLQRTSSLKNWLTALGIVNITTIALLVWLWHYTRK